MKEVIIRLDYANGYDEAKGILVDGRHILFLFNISVLLAVDVKKEDNYYWSDKANIILGKSKNNTLEFLKEMESKLKTTTLFDFFTKDKNITFLDYDFELTEK
ncbi:hypothetical protein ABC255_08595 [Neobacillus sp. 3P2-tot-E-2]|uniref:hypothetical protein n=1 Tax=Neobacillus sp. 3P2-tot-E-2 TaxID=3132212 RepID=UPI0039A148A9